MTATFVQLLCAAGHYNECNPTEYGKLKYCGSDTNGIMCHEPIIWQNPVRYDFEDIDFILLDIKVAATYCKCDKCGHNHMIEEPRYKIPEPEE